MTCGISVGAPSRSCTKTKAETGTVDIIVNSRWVCRLVNDIRVTISHTDLLDSALPLLDLLLETVQVVALEPVHDEQRGAHIPTQEHHPVQEIFKPDVPGLHLDLRVCSVGVEGSFRVWDGTALAHLPSVDALSFEVFLIVALFRWVEQGIVEVLLEVLLDELNHPLHNNL